MEKLLISVIIPVYNVEKYIDKCVESVVRQTYKNLEIWLVDDGSTDSSGVYCQKWVEKDERINVIHQKNRGLSAARNIAIDKCSGEWLAFVDSDDWLDNNFFMELMEACQKYQADISMCGYYEVYEKEGGYELKEEDTSLRPGNIAKNEAVEKIIYDKEIHSYAWNKLYKKELFDGLMFPEGRGYEDVAILYKLFLKADNIAIVDKPLYYYYMREGSILHSRDISLSMDQYHIYKEQLEVLKNSSPELYRFMVKRNRDFAVSTFCYYLKSYRNKIDFSEEIKELKTDVKNYNSILKKEKGDNEADCKMKVRMLFLRIIK